jgi:hypothetical protein
MSEIETLRGTIENLYEVFSPYCLRERIDVCYECHDLEDDLLLRSKELRELGVNELYHYISDAMYTWGDDYDFRHFLPRILEIFALDERLTDEFMDPPMVVEQLRHGKWTHWPTKEQEAVRRYLFALWESKINHEFPWEDYSAPFIEEWLCGIAEAEDDLEPYLVRWGHAASSAAVGNLSHLIVSIGEELGEGKLWYPSWPDRQVQYSQVVKWLLGQAVREKLIISSAQNLSSASLTWAKRACATLELLA